MRGNFFGRRTEKEHTTPRINGAVAKEVNNMGTERELAEGTTLLTFILVVLCSDLSTDTNLS